MSNLPPAYSEAIKQPNYSRGYQPVPHQGYQAGANPAVPQGYQPVAHAQPSYMGSTTVVVPQSSVVIVGGCPACRVGVLEDDFTCLGVCCAIMFFPIGLICCLTMRERRCPHCGAVFG